MSEMQPGPAPSDEGGPWVEIGGERMTQRQFDAARLPLLSGDPGPTTARSDEMVVAYAAPPAPEVERLAILAEVARECALDHEARGYVVVQMSRETWEELRAARAALADRERAEIGNAHTEGYWRGFDAGWEAKASHAALCACGKPLSHLDTDPDGDDWPCRVPETAQGPQTPADEDDCPLYGKHRNTESLIPASYAACKCGYRGPYNPDRFA